ncbi:MAG: hypothetical protein M0D53_04295 [Flavobacterium sp. JAD_PAG50586_2]|nr:MAG: hypothetical protein M0D53_04295 [Flavobacterium sp. JAD_PAG50586_2]
MYNESMGYDKNGNIKELKRWGDFDSDIYAAIKIDELHYYYENDNKNRLMKVTDASNSPKGFYDDAITDPADASDDYGYDDYGNMTSDENKKIMNIVYNHLNLPVEINFGAGNKIEYLYDASGRKLWKKAAENTSEIDVDYLDGFQYMNGVLDFFPHAEGYVKVLTCPECEIKRTFNYVYQYKDHLGNIRMSYGVDPEEEEVTLKILEENHYYPFGLKHTKYNSNEKMYELVDFQPTIKDILAAGGSTYKYKYNGKEYQDELGLNMYDYGARNYDPAIGRWMNIDPKAEEYRRWSPYNYCKDNPIVFVDPDGMGVDWHPDMKGNLIADKGDSATTLANYLEVKVDRAKEILKSNDATKLQVGDKITSSEIKAVTKEIKTEIATTEKTVSTNNKETASLQKENKQLAAENKELKSEIKTNSLLMKSEPGDPKGGNAAIYSIKNGIAESDIRDNNAEIKSNNKEIQQNNTENKAAQTKRDKVLDKYNVK